MYKKYPRQGDIKGVLDIKNTFLEHREQSKIEISKEFHNIRCEQEHILAAEFFKVCSDSDPISLLRIIHLS